MAVFGRIFGAFFAAWALVWASGAQAGVDPAPTAASAIPPVEAFGRLPHLDEVVLSPSGKRVAFVTEVQGVRAVVVLEDGKLIDKAVVAEAAPAGAKGPTLGKIRWVKWADDEHLTVTVEKTENLTAVFGRKMAFYQVLVLDPVTHKSFWVFQHELNVLTVVEGEYGFSTRDGHAYGYYSTQPIVERRGGVQDFLNLFEVDLDTGHAHLLAEGISPNQSWLIGRDGAILAYATYETEAQMWRLYDGKHHAQLAESKNAFDDAEIEGEGRTPGTIVYSTPDSDEATHYFERALEPGGVASPLLEGSGAVELLHDRATHLLVGYETGGDQPERFYFDPARQALWTETKKAFEGVNVDLASANAAFDRLVLFTDGKGDSGTYWQVDIAAQKVARLGRVYPEISASAIGSRTVFDYKAQDGLQLHGVLTLPPGRPAHGLPVILLPHGGPEAHDDTSFDWWAAALASRGYAVFQPNFRGSNGYGADLVTAGYGEWGRKMQTDVSDGLAALAAKGIVDPKRACIMGASYGGYAALAGVTLQHGLYRCAVAVAGVSDLRAMLADKTHWEASVSPAMRYLKKFMGARHIDDAGLALISPANQAAHADAPILLIHGKDDTTVPFDQSERMERALKGAGKPVEFVRLEGEDHLLSREATRIAMLQAAVAFVEKYDPPN